MKKNSDQRPHQKTFKRFFISYLAILLILLGINSLYYNRSYYLLREESVRANLTQASRFAQTVESEVSHIVNTLLSMEKSSSFIYCLNDDNMHRRIDRVNLRTLCQQLSVARSDSTLDLFIYFKNMDLIVSSRKTIAESSIYYSLYQCDDGPDAFASLLSADQYLKCGVVQYEGQPCLAIAQTLPTSTRVNAHAVAVSVLHPKALSSFMEAGHTAQGAVAIYSSDGNLLVASDESIAPASLPEGLHESYTKVALNGKDYYINLFDSSSLSCRYASIMELSVFTEKVDSLRKLQYAIVGAVLLIGLAVAWYLTRRNLKPLVETVQAVADSSQIRWRKSHDDEFSYLKNTLQSTVDDKLLFQNMLDRTGHFVSQTFLYGAIHGALAGKNDLAADFAANRLPCVSNDFRLVLLRPLGEPLDIDLIEKNARELAYESSSICHVIRMVSPDVLLLLNMPGAQPGDPIDSFAGELRRRLPHPAVVAVSAQFTGGTGIRDAYRQITALSEYAVVYGSDRLLTPDLMAESDAFNLNARFYQAATNMIQQAICDEAQDIDALPEKLRKIYSDDEAAQPVSAQCFIYDIRGVMSTVLASLPDLPAQAREGIWAVSDAENLPACDRCLVACVRSARLALPKKQETDDLFDRVDAFLLEHYADSSLSLNSFEKVFDISGAYLSEKYKQARGRSIPEQLNALRMEKAGELLRQSDLPLERIGELVGILNTSTLIRSFKKHMGVTPGAYRKNHAFAEKKPD